MMEKLDSQSPNHILIGLGGTGGKVLKALRKRLFLEFPNETDRAQLSIGFIYVDSTREMMQPGDPSFKVMGKDASFTESEFVDIKSVNLGQILDNVDNFPGLKNIVRNGASMRNTLGEVGAAAGQKRRAGRILFAANCNKYVAALRAQYEKVRAISRKDSVNIHIFTGLAGGTGSGAIIDAVAQARAQASFRDAVITVYAMVPELEIPAGCQAGRYHQNGYAALCELSALNVGRFLPCDVIRGDEHISLDLDSNKQFGLMLYSNINENGVTVNSFTELPQLLADTIYFRMFLEYNADTTGDFIRGLSSENINDFCVEYSVKSKGNDKERARTKAISSFGIKRVIYPEKRIIEHISYTIGQQVLRQMQYNNFKDDFGFVQESVKKDYKQLYINDAHLRDWRLSDSFLTLNEKIYDTDKNFDSIQDYWKSTTNFYSYDDAKAADKNPLKYLKSIIQRVTFPILSKIQDDTERLANIYRKYIKITSLGIFFLMVLLASLAKPMIIFLITDKWFDAIIFVQIMCYALMFDHLNKINLNLLYVKGKTNLVLRLEIIKKILGFIILLISIPIGVLAICIANVINCQIAIIVNTYYSGKYINLGYWKQFKDYLPYLLIAHIACFPAWLLSTLIDIPILVLVVGPIISTVIYVICLEMIKDRIYIEDIKPIIKKTFSYVSTKLIH